MIICIAMIPLLFSISLLTVSYANHSYVSLTALNLCRKNLLLGQDKIRLQIVKLIKLNPQAKLMRRKIKTAKRLANAARKSRDPRAIAIAEAYLIFVKGQQAVLQGVQKLHIQKAKFYGLKYKAKLIKDLKNLNSEANIKVENFPFAINRTPSKSPTPNYNLKSNFLFKQQVKAYWSINKHNKQFLKLFQNAKPAAISNFCGASIDDKEGVNWRAVLIKKDRL